MSILGKLGRFFRGDSSTAAPLALPPAAPALPARWRGDAISLNLGQPAGLMMGGFSNPVTGHGMPGVDSRMASQYRAGWMTDELAIEMWRGDEIAHRIISMLPREALEPGIEITIQDEERTADGQVDTRPAAQLVEDVEAMHRNLRTEAVILRACEWERLFGGAAIWAGANDFRAGDWSEPLDLGAPMMRLQWLDVIRSRDLYPHAYYEDPGHPKYGQVAVWRLSRVTGSGRISQQALIHESRLYLFRGRRIVEDGTIITQNLASAEFGDGIMLAIQPELRRFVEALDNTELAMRANGELVWQHQRLAEILGQEGEGEEFKALVSAMSYAQSILRARVVGADQTLTRQGVSLAGLSELVDKYENRVAGISGTPRTKLFGESPGGLGNNGAGPQGDWDETKRVYRKNNQLPAYEWVTRLGMRALGGEPKRWKLEGKPYRQPTEQEKTAQVKEEAGIDVQLMQAQVITVDEVRARPIWRERYSLPDPAAELDMSQVPDDIRDPGGQPPGGGPAGPGTGGGGREEAPPEQPKPAELALTGPQALALSAIAEKVAAGTLPPESGVEMAVFSFKVPPEQASRMMPTPAAKSTPAAAPPVTDSKVKRADAVPRQHRRSDVIAVGANNPVSEPADPALARAIERIELVTPYQIRALDGEDRESLVATLEIVHGIPCELADRLIPQEPGEYGGEGPDDDEDEDLDDLDDDEEREDADRDDCANPIRGEGGLFEGCEAGSGSGASGGSGSTGKGGSGRAKAPKDVNAIAEKRIFEKQFKQFAAGNPSLTRAQFRQQLADFQKESRESDARRVSKATPEQVAKERAAMEKRLALKKAKPLTPKQKEAAKKKAIREKEKAKKAREKERAAKAKAREKEKIAKAKAKERARKEKEKARKAAAKVKLAEREKARKERAEARAKAREEKAAARAKAKAEKAAAKAKAKEPAQGKPPSAEQAPPAQESPSAETRIPAATVTQDEHKALKAAHEATRTPEQKKAEFFYAGAAAFSINRGLRKNNLHPVSDKKFIDSIKELDSSIASSAPLEKDTALFRGSSLDGADFFKELKPGDVFGDPGYTSTSVSEEYMKTSNSTVHIRIRAPKGTRAAPIATDQDHEQEMLLPRGSRFRVEKYKAGTQVVKSTFRGKTIETERPLIEMEVTLLGEEG